MDEVTPARVGGSGHGVKLSSWPLPQDAWKYFATMAAFDAIANHPSFA